MLTHRPGALDDAATNDSLVAVIILNWNGWADTLECLNSLVLSDYSKFDIVVVDNGSTNESFEKLREWGEANFEPLNRMIMGSSLATTPTAREQGAPRRHPSPTIAKSNGPNAPVASTGRFVLIQSGENRGFAGGNNVGIRYAIGSGAEFIWLLNNDTTVDRSALRLLVRFLRNGSGFDGVTGQIRYFHHRSLVWNCGGNLSWLGSRKYYFANAPVSSVPESGWKSVTFITGCALMLRASTLKELGLLSEKFFFGEEDIELCYRLRRERRRLACVYGAVIYHKVSASIGGVGAEIKIGWIYIHLLLRFINMKDFFAAPVWRVWRICVLFYVVPMLLVRYRLGVATCWRIILTLLQNSESMTRVTREDFFGAINGHGDTRREN